MARNKVLEQLLGDDLAQVRGITEKAMFGGWAWLLNGNLLCGARNDGMLVRLGKGNDAWALATPGYRSNDNAGPANARLDQSNTESL